METKMTLGENMKTKIALLFVFSAALWVPKIALAYENRPPYYLTDAELDKNLGVEENAATPNLSVWLVYFHRVPGCDTCQLMSQYIYETVGANFKDEANVKSLVLRYRNFEEEKNEVLVKKLNIKSPSLAILIVQNGKVVKAKLAGKIWSLAGDKKAFLEYVTEEILAYKKEIDAGKCCQQ